MSAPAPRISLLAALDRRFAIGRDNQLPWRLPDDLRRFKALSLGKPVLMGRKTAQSLGRALPGRENLVLTHQPSAPFDGMQVVTSLDDAIARAGAAELVVIGGGEIYRLCLPLADTLYLTHVETEVPDADVFFPEFDLSRWRVTRRLAHPADARHEHAFEFVDYRRRGG